MWVLFYSQGIVGNLASGKSALVHRYLTGTYVQEESPEGEKIPEPSESPVWPGSESKPFDRFTWSRFASQLLLFALNQVHKQIYK